MSDQSGTWTEADLGDPALRKHIRERLVLIALMEEGHLTPLGTGFVVSISDDHAVVVTASHTLEEIRNQQNPRLDTTFRSFTPGLVVEPRKEIDISRLRVRVLCWQGDQMQAAVIERAQYAQRTDIAVLRIRSQDTESPLVHAALPLTPVVPAVGDEIAVLGYAAMVVTDRISEGNFRSQRMSVRPVMRRGYVTETSRLVMGEGMAVHASIPVFGGMSGGPVMLMDRDGNIGPVFGVVASSPNADPTTACNMAAAVLQVAQIEFHDGAASTAIAFESEVDVTNQEFAQRNQADNPGAPLEQRKSRDADGHQRPGN